MSPSLIETKPTETKPTETKPAPSKRKPEANWFYATKPTRWTLFLRTFLPWQLWRFVWINLKMVRIIGRSHGAQALRPGHDRRGA